MKNERWQLEDLILKILVVAMDQKMDKGLQERMKKKIKKKKGGKK